MKNNIVICTRHKGTVEWLKRRDIIGAEIERASVKHIRDKYVIGNVPLRIAHTAKAIYGLVIPGIASCVGDPSDLSADELEDCGAYLERYTVTRDDTDLSELR